MMVCKSRLGAFVAAFLLVSAGRAQSPSARVEVSTLTALTVQRVDFEQGSLHVFMRELVAGGPDEAPRPVSQVVELPLASLRCFSGEGRSVPIESLRDRLQGGQTVLYGLGTDLEPALVRLVRPDALILLRTLQAPASPPDPAASSPPEKPQDPQDVALSDDEQALLDFTNAERQKKNLAPLIAAPVLMQLARRQSADMARLSQISHELEGRTFAKRLEESGYQPRTAGENCAEGARTPQEAVGDWMTSPGHSANILSPGYTHIGVGVATSQAGRRYYTQVFAAPF